MIQYEIPAFFYLEYQLFRKSRGQLRDVENGGLLTPPSLINTNLTMVQERRTLTIDVNYV